MATQEQLWLPSSCHLDLVTQACVSARWQGYSNWHRLGLPFKLPEKAIMVWEELLQPKELQGSSKSTLLRHSAPKPWPSLKASYYASIFETFPDPWRSSLPLDWCGFLEGNLTWCLRMVPWTRLIPNLSQFLHLPPCIMYPNCITMIQNPLYQTCPSYSELLWGITETLQQLVVHSYRLAFIEGWLKGAPWKDALPLSHQMKDRKFLKTKFGKYWNIS